MRSLFLLPLLAMAVAGPVQAAKPAKASKPARVAKAPKPNPSLLEAVAAPHRSEANRARDQYRNPAQTLAFFGVKPTDTVVEIWPGGGWYSEILAPYLSGSGRLILAAPKQGEDGLRKLVDGNQSVFSKAIIAHFPASVSGGDLPVPPASADVVLTFRNVHNWRIGSGHPEKADYSAAAFKELYAMLKPGGTLGIVDHRLNEDADAERERSSGYIKVSSVKKMAQDAGFKLVASSEINANPKDTKDYPKGVWTLPPRFAEGESDKAKYQAIGESDRMTLKFMKPKG